MKIFSNKTILITGHTGFKGSWLCAWLNALGADVSGFALPPKPDAPLFNQLKLGERIQQYDGDIRDIEAIKKCEDRLKPGNKIGEVFDAHAKTFDNLGFKKSRMNACGYS